jgi:cytosine/adenosine deaminase-related metal-dependent hydrolase
VLDGSGLLLLPGLIDIHAHPSTEPALRGVREDHGSVGARADLVLVDLNHPLMGPARDPLRSLTIMRPTAR